MSDLPTEETRPALTQPLIAERKPPPPPSGAEVKPVTAAVAKTVKPRSSLWLEWTPAALTVLVLAFGLAVCLVLLAAGAVFRDAPVATPAGYILSTTLGAVVGAVAVFIGTMDRQR